MELTYTEVDGYFYPDLTLPETEDHRPLGKYGLLRKTYLKRYRPMMYDWPQKRGWTSSSKPPISCAGWGR